MCDRLCAARELARGIARFPLEAHARALLSPATDRAGGADGTFGLPRDGRAQAGRHAWSLGAGRAFHLASMTRGRQIKTALEIGTFKRRHHEAPRGGTSRKRPCHDHRPASGAVYATQHPAALSGDRIGFAYRDSPAAARVEQLLEHSLEFDTTPYAARYDLVLVDGGHEFVHGVATRARPCSSWFPAGSSCGRVRALLARTRARDLPRDDRPVALSPCRNLARRARRRTRGSGAEHVRRTLIV